MITANMHEAKTHLSALVKAVVEKGETVILQRNGTAVAQITPISTPVRRDKIPPDPSLRATFAPGYDPAEPLSEDEWPSECR